MMAAPAPQEFFKENRSTSEVKAELLRQFVPAWYRLRFQEGATDFLTFADLLAGQEREDLASLSDADTAATSPYPWFPHLCQLITSKHAEALRLFFGASSKPELETLKHQVERLGHESELSHPPLLLHEPENQQLLTELLAQSYPALLIMDPFATTYAQQLFLENGKTGAADLLLLLHPKKLRLALTGKKTPAQVSEIFGNKLNSIQTFCRREKNAQGQEAFIIRQLEETLREQECQTLDFRVDAPDKDQTNLYLLFASRSVPVYKAFKKLLLPYSDLQQDGVPLFGANLKQRQQLSLFPDQLRFSVQKLAEDLAAKASQYNYKTIEKIAEDHHPGTHYIIDNYRLAFEKLRDLGKVETLNPKTLQTVRKATLASPVKFKQKL